jgi:hypothetical protein
MSNIVELSNCRIVELSNCQIVEHCRISKLSAHHLVKMIGDRFKFQKICKETANRDIEFMLCDGEAMRLGSECTNATVPLS